MVSLPYKNQDRNLLTQFLRTIHYQSSSGKSTYANALFILRAIFEASGQQHLLYLVKLRKLWFAEIDKFLARNAYPRNISVLRQFTVNDEFTEELIRAGVSADFLKAAEKLKGESFNGSAQLKGKLLKQLKRLLSTEEKDLLKQKVRFKPHQTILHLTVYDGSISQALRFETEAYIHMFQRLLPELKLDDIRCHVGDLGQAQFDQTQVASLAKDWHLLTPEGVHQNCMPAFLHRVSRSHAVLVLYVSSVEGLEFLNRIPGAEWIVQHLHKQRTELQGVLQKIAFVPRPELDLEQVRLRSFVLGDIPLEKSAVAAAQERSFLTVESSKTPISAQQQFAKISRQLRAKPVDTHT
ncbi:MAG: hypothetical protein VYA87_02985 [SAR324 cluster bacterium]|nr:hypothetical protein [SAR324 cluster bacterium]